MEQNNSNKSMEAALQAAEEAVTSTPRDESLEVLWQMMNEDGGTPSDMGDGVEL